MKRRIIKFVSFAAVIDFALDALCNLLRINIPLFSQSVSASNILGAITALSTFIIFLLLGYNLSKDKTSAVVFSGTMYFSSYIPNLVLILVSALMSYFPFSEDISPVTTAVEEMTGFVLLPLEIFIGVYAYTAFVGINDKMSQKGMADFTMSVSRARKRYIVATVVQILSASLITSMPLMFSFLSDEDMSGFVVRLFAWISSVVLFLIIYYAGYKPGKNHTEAMAFFSAYALGGGISSLISSLFSAVIAPMISKVLTSGLGDETTQEVLNEMFSEIDVDTFSFVASSPLLLVLTFVVTLYVFKFFFEDETEEFYAQ
ncbi:MAG: hypothetical protein IJB74_00070 [Clostridia bacterium]|nr:hypothetical protein [Clostridia bacterium]